MNIPLSAMAPTAVGSRLARWLWANVTAGLSQSILSQFIIDVTSKIRLSRVSTAEGQKHQEIPVG